MLSPVHCADMSAKLRMDAERVGAAARNLKRTAKDDRAMKKAAAQTELLKGYAVWFEHAAKVYDDLANMETKP